MHSTAVIRFLVLLIPAVWVILRLMPADHPRYTNLQVTAQEAPDLPTHRKVDTFATHESLFQAHYQAHYASSGYDYPHYRLAYKYGFDLALESDNRRLDWNSVEPQARNNWDERTLGQWSQHRQAVLYGWEQGIQFNGR